MLAIVICCSTKALVSLNVRLKEALTAVYKLSNDVVQQLLDKIRPRASTMHAMVESIAVLDMLLRYGPPSCLSVVLQMTLNRFIAL